MQLVELQRSVIEQPGDDVAVYAISYDPAEALARFAVGHGIRFPLLSDVGSRVITELGMLNHTIEQDQAAVGKPFGERHRGLPYPGTFLLDEAGNVVAKRFERAHRNRPSGRTLLGSLLGSLPPHTAGLARADFPGGSLAGWVDTTTVQPNQVQDAHLRLRLDPGFHVYTEPVPQGFTALDLRVDGDDRIHGRPAAIPAGRPFHLDGLDEEFRVLEGEVEVSRPFLVFSPEADVSAQPAEVELVLEVTLQTVHRLPVPPTRVDRTGDPPGSGGGTRRLGGRKGSRSGTGAGPAGSPGTVAPRRTGPATQGMFDR